MKAYVKSRRAKPKPEEFQDTIDNNRLVNHIPRSGNWFSALNNDISESSIDSFIEDMQEFIVRHGAFEVIPFLREKKISWQSWHNMLERFPRLKTAYVEMKIHLGYNQREAVRNGEIDARFSVMSMHTYDPEYDAINKYHSSLKQLEANNQGGTIEVRLMPIEECPTVPLKPPRITHDDKG